MITLAVPKSAKLLNINKEIAECRNIKDKNNRNNTMRGLYQIKYWA
jgi:hypothetical protein